MGFFVATLVAGCFVMTAFHFWRRFCDEQFTVGEWQLFRRWVGKGILLPLGLWLFANTGFGLPPVLPIVPPLAAGFGAWLKALGEVGALSAVIISSFWCGVTLLWLLARIGQRVDSRASFYGICGLWALLLLPVGLIIVLTGGWAALGVAMTLCSVPLVHFTLPLTTPAVPVRPTYSRALAKISFSKYDEAEKEIIQELEQCEDDFDGWMMLAELYATHFNDLPSAAQTVQDLCAQETTTTAQMAVALHRLADWQLKIGHDPEGARRTLLLICARAPGTHLDKMAQQRLDQLPVTREALRELELGKPLRLPQVPEEIITPALVLPREQATAAAHECVETLNRNPDDMAAREKFARLLAESLGEPAIAIEQLELLVALSHSSPDQRAGWLLTMAGWHARQRNDADQARLIYQQVMRDFSNTPHAFAAQRRLNLLNLQSQLRKRSAERATV